MAIGMVVITILECFLLYFLLGLSMYEIQVKEKVKIGFLIWLAGSNIMFYCYFNFGYWLLLSIFHLLLLLIAYIDFRTTNVWRVFSFPLLLIGIVMFFIFNGTGIYHFFLPLWTIILILFGFFELWGLGDSFIMIAVTLMLLSISSPVVTKYNEAMNLSIVIIQFMITETFFVITYLLRRKERKKSYPFCPYIYLGCFLTIALLPIL